MIDARDPYPALEMLAEQFATQPAVEPLTQCAPLLRAGFAGNFARGGGPSGAWPPHAPATVARYGPHPLLILSGAMLAAATTQGTGSVTDVSASALAVGVDLGVIPYARAQNYGHERIPQREYLDVDDHVLNDCEQLVGDYFFDHAF